jgi:hypothetical protein
MIITLPIQTVSEANARCHWAKRAKRVKHQRQTVAMVMAGRVICDGLRAPCAVTLTRIAPRALDDDNLRGALKAARDGVADALGIRDNDPRVTWSYGQERGSARHYAVRIEVRSGS